MAEPVQVEPRDPRFASALAKRGAASWADPAFPYDLAGVGTASGKGAARILEESVQEAEGEAGPLSAAEASRPAIEGAGAGSAVRGAVFVTEGEQAGAIGVIVRPGYLHGEIVRTALLRDLALPPDGAVARRLVEAAMRFAREQDAAVAVVGSRTGEAPFADLAIGWEAVPAFRRVAEFKAVRIVPALWRFEEPEYKVLVATRTEIPAIAYLLDFYRQGFAFAAPVDEASFVRGVERCPNFKIGDFRLARYKGELAAICGVWEPGDALPVRLERPSAGEAILGLLGRVLGRLSPFPRLPGAGGRLRVRFVRCFAAKQGHPAVLKYLLDRVANETRKAGAHAFEIVLGADDPQLELVSGRLRRVRTPSVWAAPLSPDLDLAEPGPVDPGILDPGF